MEIRLRSVVSEISSAYADLGTFLPLMLGTVLVAGMNPVGILYGFGLFALMTALVYRLPIPVQPMKAVAAMAIAGMATPEVLMATGLLLGGVLLVLSTTDVTNSLKCLIPNTVLHGMRVALAISLVSTTIGLADFGSSPLWLLLAGLIILQITALRIVSCLLVLVCGWWFLVPELPIGFVVERWYWPAFSWPSSDALVLSIKASFFPQLALTITNAMILTAVIAKEYFPENEKALTERRLAFTSGIANLLLAPMGAMPMCHGAGGLVAHHTLGSRTGWSIAVFGITCILLAGLLGEQVIALLQTVPNAVLGALVLYAAWILCDPITLFRAKLPCQLVIISMVPVALVYDLMAALVFGLAAEVLRARLMRVLSS